jgi:S-methylmethionine-dependent homocysteine/selenocysteine methylase
VFSQWSQKRYMDGALEIMRESITLLDGGMGQELIRRSGAAPTPLWSTRVLLDNPELVEALHMDFIKAGAKAIVLSNYTATPTRLARDASIDLFEPIHEAAKRLALSARRKSGVEDVMIAGCLAPIVASYKPELVPDADVCLEQYRDLVAIQKSAIDLMFCETMATIREAVAAATAAREAGLPTIVSFTLDDSDPGQLRSGEPLSEAVSAVAPLGLEAVTVNCSMPEAVTAAMPQLADAFPRVGGYANGFQSISPLDAGGTTANMQVRQDLTPKAYAQYALGWAEAGAKLIGGCCEVGPEHIAETGRVLEAAGYKVVPFDFG